MSLTDIIAEKIRQYGPISFRDFMEMALYYPEFGYYTSSKDKIGKTGDYYTGPNISQAFGEMLGRQIGEMQRILGEKEFAIVEIGAGTGLLSGDVYRHLKKNQDVRYYIVEKSPAMREEQKKRLDENVQWFGSIEELPEITGCIFSNELVDAFPVHQVVMKKELMEVFVDYGDDFFEILKPTSRKLKDYLAQMQVVLPYGYRTEINLDAIRWIEEIASVLRKGFVVTIDYGYPSQELYQEHRNSGTLMCYYRHTANDNPYQHIGEQDITSHVNFSALEHWGSKNGLVPCGFTDQAHFLLGLGIEEYLKKLQESKDYLKKMLAVKTLMMEMGETFKILIHRKGTECNGLSGLKFQSHWKI